MEKTKRIIFHPVYITEINQQSAIIQYGQTSIFGPDFVNISVPTLRGSFEAITWSSDFDLNQVLYITNSSSLLHAFKSITENLPLALLSEDSQTRQLAEQLYKWKNENGPNT